MDEQFRERPHLEIDTDSDSGNGVAVDNPQTDEGHPFAFTVSQDTAESSCAPQRASGSDCDGWLSVRGSGPIWF